MPTRTLPFTLTAGALLYSGLVLAKDAAVSTPTRPARQYTAEESIALGAEADRRAEARQRRFDRRLKQISGSICDGC